jgi:hypothetical protein
MPNICWSERIGRDRPAASVGPAGIGRRRYLFVGIEDATAAFQRAESSLSSI